MKVALSNQKYFKSRNGYGMNANLFIDGIKAASIRDAGDGGAMSFDVYDKQKFSSFENEIKKCPPTFFPQLGMELSLSVDFFISLLDDAQATGKKLKLSEIEN